jgi:hypothetical protein
VLTFELSSQTSPCDLPKKRASKTCPAETPRPVSPRCSTSSFHLGGETVVEGDADCVPEGWAGIGMEGRIEP